MPIELIQVVDNRDYIDLVGKFSALVDKELSLLENDRSADRGGYLVERLPSMISLVNTIGYFRGDDGVFRDKALTSARKSDLVKNESAFERRLYALISEVGKFSKQDAFLRRLEKYYMGYARPELTDKKASD